MVHFSAVVLMILMWTTGAVEIKLHADPTQLAEKAATAQESSDAQHTNKLAYEAEASTQTLNSKAAAKAQTAYVTAGNLASSQAVADEALAAAIAKQEIVVTNQADAATRLSTQEGEKSAAEEESLACSKTLQQKKAALETANTELNAAQIKKSLAVAATGVAREEKDEKQNAKARASTGLTTATGEEIKAQAAMDEATEKYSKVSDKANEIGKELGEAMKAEDEAMQKWRDAVAASEGSDKRQEMAIQSRAAAQANYDKALKEWTDLEADAVKKEKGGELMKAQATDMASTAAEIGAQAATAAE